MDLSAVIFVVLAVAWAVFLIPMALRRHDEVARTRSIDRFSTKLRVLAHREPGEGVESRLVVTPARATRRGTVPVGVPATISTTVTVPAVVSAEPTPTAAAVPVAPALSAARLRARRTAARAAARRRRRVLSFLLLCTVVVAAGVYLGRLLPWDVAVPGGLTLLYVVLCRTQVRHEVARDVAVAAPGSAPAAAPAETPAAAVETTTTAPAPPPDEAVVTDVDDEDEDDTVGIPVALLRAAAAGDDGSSSLWDPLPVTLPTYVTAPKARRTVRTIDLGEPGTWTSGRTAEDTEIVARASAEQAAEKTSEKGTGGSDRRAVGS